MIRSTNSDYHIGVGFEMNGVYVGFRGRRS